MAKKVTAVVKLQLPAGKATPAPPVGSALGPHGINIPGFTKDFNARTADKAGLIIPVIVTIYQDHSFTFILKTPPAPVLIKKACGIESGSAVPKQQSQPRHDLPQREGHGNRPHLLGSQTAHKAGVRQAVEGVDEHSGHRWNAQ